MTVGKFSGQEPSDIKSTLLSLSTPVNTAGQCGEVMSVFRMNEIHQNSDSFFAHLAE